MTTERAPQGPTSYDEYEVAEEALEEGGLDPRCLPALRWTATVASEAATTSSKTSTP